MVWVRLAIRELFVNRGFSAFFILNLAVGLAGFIAVQSFGRAIDQYTATNLKEILTADLVLSAGSPLTAAETEIVDQALGPNVRRAAMVSFYTMLRPEQGQARLVKVMAVNPAYPLYGAFSMETGYTVADLEAGPGLFMTRDTALTLGLGSISDPGSGSPAPLVMGEKPFHVLDFFREDPDKSLAVADLAPKVYMGLSQLDGTGLVRFGSRIRYVYFFAFPDSRDVPALTRQINDRLFDLSQGKPRIQVFDTRDANRQLGRLTRYVTGYMGMVSLVALFLAGMSAAFLFRGAVAARQHQMAILLGIGAVRREAVLWVLIQLVVLGAAASLLALGGALALLPVFPQLFRGLVPPGLDLSLDLPTLGLALGLGMAGSLVFCLPVFVRLFSASPLDLLRTAAGPGTQRPKARWGILASLPGLAAFLGMAVISAGTPKDGLIFALGFSLALAGLSLVGLLVFFLCGRLAERPGLWFPLRLALRSLVRHRWASLSCFVTIAAAVFLMALIPQIQKGLETEIMRPEGMKLPVFFLVDIQEEQVAPLKSFMAGRPGDLAHLSPMVPGRILSVNGKPFFDRGPEGGKKSRPGQIRGQRLEFIFSHRDALSDSESLAKGAPLDEAPWDWNGPFGVSVAVSFAQRHDLDLGDLMEFDIQGITLTGQVKNLRKVRWNSFQPNFFLLFQNGVLDEAPKTYLGTISNLTPEFRTELKNALMASFPNVSVLDVTQTATTILAVADRLSLSVRFMAWLALGAGLVSIFSIARHQARQNRQQVNLLKVLGTGALPLQIMGLAEFGILGFSAALSALGLSLVFSRGVSIYFFDSLWALDLPYLLVILGLATGICMVTGMAAARQVMQATPLDLLKA